MKAYEVINNTKTFQDYQSQRIQQIDGVWYWNEWCVSYSQQGVASPHFFVKLEDSQACFERLFQDYEKCWGNNTVTTKTESNDQKRIVFKKKRGTLTGTLTLRKLVVS